MKRERGSKLAGDLAEAGFSCHQTFQKRSPHTSVVIDEKRVSGPGLEHLLSLTGSLYDYGAELHLIDGVLQFLPTGGT